MYNKKMMVYYFRPLNFVLSIAYKIYIFDSKTIMHQLIFWRINKISTYSWKMLLMIIQQNFHASKKAALYLPNYEYSDSKRIIRLVRLCQSNFYCAQGGAKVTHLKFCQINCSIFSSNNNSNTDSLSFD